VGRSLEATLEVLAYESAEGLVRGQDKVLVAPCICRKEHKIKGGGCGKIDEACLVFGWGAEFYQRNGLGRMIDQDEALGILKRADKEGLVVCSPATPRRSSTSACAAATAARRSCI
jgi:hypothetical protein